jgi:hypothetical protein
MKSVLRSAFDPVPRPLSQGTQLLLAGVLIVGIAISVVEYVESSGRTMLAADAGRPAAKVQVLESTPTPAEPVAHPRSLVRVAPRPNAPVSGSTTPCDPGATSLPGASSVAPMSIQPPEGG